MANVLTLSAVSTSPAHRFIHRQDMQSIDAILLLIPLLMLFFLQNKGREGIVSCFVL
jgi:hypothetical protein